MDSRIRESIVDRGIAKGEREMRNLSKELQPEGSNQEPHVGRVGEHNSGQMAAEASDQIGTPPVASSPVVSSKDEGPGKPDISEDDIRDRKVNPEAVRESFKEAELDPLAETEPEEGESAA